MKKVSLSVLFLFIFCLGGCSYDIGMLGYKNDEYPEQKEKNVAVCYENIIPGDCRKIAVVIADIDDSLQCIIDNLREEAAEVGANVVNISSIDYAVSYFSSFRKSMFAEFYICERPRSILKQNLIKKDISKKEVR